MTMYIQLHEDGTYWRQVRQLRNFAFGPNHFQPPETLTAHEAEIFRVHPLALTTRPAVDEVTQGVREAPPAMVQGVWTQQWEVYPLPAEEVAANQAAAAQAAREQAKAKRQAAREQAKAKRQAAVDAIKVTTALGNTFDGDETSQTRMTRAVLAMQATGASSVTWVLADNTVIQATVPELTGALALAGAEQARLWVIE